MLTFVRMPVIAALILIFAGCSTRQTPIAVQPAPAPVVAYTPAPPAVSPINRDLSPAATLWHFRVALNVAALACRGASEAAIVANYNAMLIEQKPLLAATQAALSSEYRAFGNDWQDRYDDSMTRLYNFFSQAQARTRFCAAAEQVLAEARTIPATSLAGFAEARLPMLDAPFVTPFDARPVIAVAAPLPQRPVQVAAATPRPASRIPWLRVDVASLGE